MTADLLWTGKSCRIYQKLSCWVVSCCGSRTGTKSSRFSWRKTPEKHKKWLKFKTKSCGTKKKRHGGGGVKDLTRDVESSKGRVMFFLKHKRTEVLTRHSVLVLKVLHKPQFKAKTFKLKAQIFLNCCRRSNIKSEKKTVILLKRKLTFLQFFFIFYINIKWVH